MNTLTPALSRKRERELRSPPRQRLWEALFLKMEREAEVRGISSRREREAETRNISPRKRESVAERHGIFLPLPLAGEGWGEGIN
jgi:hypothetical protein